MNIWCIDVCMRVCMYTRTHINTHTHISNPMFLFLSLVAFARLSPIHTHTYMHIQALMHANKRANAPTWTHPCTSNHLHMYWFDWLIEWTGSSACICSHRHTYTHIHTRTHEFLRSHIFFFTRSYTYTHTHTHTNKRMNEWVYVSVRVCDMSRCNLFVIIIET